MSAATGQVTFLTVMVQDAARAATATDWLLDAAKDLGLSPSELEAEVDLRRRLKGVARHTAVLEVLVDLRAGLWSR